MTEPDYRTMPERVPLEATEAVHLTTDDAPERRWGALGLLAAGGALGGTAALGVDCDAD
ncbi:hypothetical protein [Vallicoccus soli]|uniref:hypothetical protein n=1 Tax=Vallicoccus soli TaxID=2339232 RepID=UPI001403B685|nr:hypothetical protein [Vallicoccus soli]